MPESIEHYFLACTALTDEREILKNALSELGIIDFNLKVILGGSDNLKKKENDILKLTLNYIRSSNKMGIL